MNFNYFYDNCKQIKNKHISVLDIIYLQIFSHEYSGCTYEAGIRVICINP